MTRPPRAPVASPPEGTRPLPPVAGQEPRRLLYSLDRDRAYHFVTFVLVVLAAVLVGLAALLTPEAMAAEFGSVDAGRAAQAVIGLVGLGPLLAWGWWLRRYVRRIVWLPATQEVELQLGGYFRGPPRRLAASAFAGHSHHEGRANFPGAPTVHAPYRRLRVRGLPPLILDDQGTTHDEPALDALLAGALPPASSQKPRAGRDRPA